MMLSRTADNLYWLSRSVERADFAARIIDATTRLSNLPKAYGSAGIEWDGALKTLGVLDSFRENHETANAENVIEFLAFDRHNPSSIRNCIVNARTNARAVRESITTEMWESINSTWLELRRMETARTASRQSAREEILPFLEFVKTAARDFDGAAYRTMLRSDRFWFNRLGLFIERADNTARILDVKYHILLPDVEPVGGSLDYFQWVSILRAVSTLTAYHWVYRDTIKPWLVADLLILRKEMPRSLVSCYENLTYYTDQLSREYGRQGPSQRHARRVFGGLENATIEDIFQNGLHEYITDFLGKNGQLGQMISEQYLLA